MIDPIYKKKIKLDSVFFQKKEGDNEIIIDKAIFPLKIDNVYHRLTIKEKLQLAFVLQHAPLLNQYIGREMDIQSNLTLCLYIKNARKLMANQN